MKTEIERARESIKEYREGYGQSQLPTDCIIQLMMGHATGEQLLLSSVTKLFTEKQMEESFNDGIACEKQRCGYFDVDNYK